jgi:PAS domain S-box-containing protein
MQRTSTILIVDDEPLGREVLATLLSGQGYHLAFASDGFETLEQAQTLVPDLIFLDVMMPGMDGFEVCRRLRADPLLAEVPVILITGLSDRDSRLRGIAAGADDFMSKPFDRLELRARVQTITRLNRYHRLLIERTRFERVVELSPAGLLIVDRAGTIWLTNPAMQQLLGGLDTIVGTNMRMLVAPDQASVWLAYLDGVFANMVQVRSTETVFVRSDGTHILVDVAIGPFLWNGEPAVQIVVRDITERKQAEERLRRAAARAEALARVAARLNAQLDLDTVLRSVCEETAQALRVPIASVSLFDERRAALYHAAAVGMPPDFGARSQPLPRAAYDVYARRMGTFLVIPDLRARSDVPNAALYAELGMRSIASAWMLREGQLVGSLNISSVHTIRHFTEDDLALLQGLAHQAAQAIANARLYTQAERRLSHVQALRAIDRAITTGHDLPATLNIILDQVAAQLHVDAAQVLLLDAQTQTLEYAAGCGFRTATVEQASWRIGEGDAGRVALERRTVSIANLAEMEGASQAPLLFSEGFAAYYGVPLIAKDQLQGVLEVFQRVAHAPDPEWLDLLETLAGQAAIAIDNVMLFDGLQRANLDLTLAYDTTIEGWSRALDLRDKETEGHSQRVTAMTLRLATTMDINAAELVHVRRGALLHDIGKMGVPDGILLKPGPLTDDEWVLMRQHPVYAYDLLLPIAYLRPALDIPYCHHEKWDGTGYPRGLRGEQIPLAARIFAVVDVWDAMRSDRPYRKGRPDAEVHEHIRSLSGTHFDPQVVQVFLERIH